MDNVSIEEKYHFDTLGFLLLKEVLKLGGDISDYVPGSIIKKIISR